jgi:hypothetical protein
MSTTQKGPNLLDQWFFVQKVVSDRRLSRCAVACAFHLVDYYNDRLGRAWPSYVTLAKLTGSNRRTVIEAVKRLIALKYFEVEKGNGRRSNYYRPNFALMVKEPAPAEASDEDATSPVAQTPPLQGVMVNFPPPNTSYIPVAPSEGDIEVSPRSAGSSALVAPSPSRGAPPGFEEFWQAYPKKEGRKAALTAYAMALQKEDVTPELLARKAAQYAEAKGANDPKYIKMPHYWLNDECWLEDPQPPKPKAAKGKPKRGTAKTTGEAKAKAKNTQRRHSAKRRWTPPKGKATHFGKNVVRYCEYLDITPEDLSLAMGLHRSRIEGACYGRKKISTNMKDQVKSLLIESVRHGSEDQPLTVEWLRELYEFMIKHEPPKRYKWMAPDRYESSEV